MSTHALAPPDAGTGGPLGGGRRAGDRHGQRTPVYGFVAAFSGTSQRTASGGSVTSAENGCSCHGRASHATPPRLPTSEPP